MIDEIYLSRNLSTSGAIRFDRDSADYLIDDDGLDWGELKAQITKTSATYAQGSSVIGVEYPEREVSITGWIIGTPEQISSKKSQLSRFIALSNTVNVLIVQNQKTYYLETWISEGVKFSPSYKYNNEFMCNFSLRLYAPYPFFKLRKTLSLSNSQQSVYNLGDLSAGMYLSMILSAEATNPSITIGNDTMHLVGEFESGDAISINTMNGQKGVYLNGALDFSILRTDSDWVHIPVTTESNPATLSLSFSISSATLEYDEVYAQIGDM